jgi:MerR family mercuric resistance operon transcriptional regulator
MYNQDVNGVTLSTIGQLARTVGVPISTVRYYERVGLLRPEARTASNYRTYSSRTIERLRFIRAAQASGFALADIREMLDLAHADADDPPCKEVAALIDRRLVDIRAQLRDLKRVERTLAKAAKTCCRGGPDWCGEIERLKGRQPPSCRTSEKCACPS